MVNLNGHETGNGGYSQGEPKVTTPLLYSAQVYYHFWEKDWVGGLLFKLPLLLFWVRGLLYINSIKNRKISIILLIHLKIREENGSPFRKIFSQS